MKTTAGTREQGNQGTRQAAWIRARGPRPEARLLDERGSALAAVLVLVVLLTMVGVAMVNSTFTEISVAYNAGDTASALYAAVPGLAWAVCALTQNTD